ncbi:hypothetical protein BDW60DRAFT_192089 [Aspergillus nidulans var. acristatus]
MTAFVLVDSAHPFYCAVFGVVSTCPFYLLFKGTYIWSVLTLSYVRRQHGGLISTKVEGKLCMISDGRGRD